jgi:hypothetical protein
MRQGISAGNRGTHLGAAGSGVERKPDADGNPREYDNQDVTSTKR